MDELPDYMQVFYHTLLNVYDEIEEEMVKEGRSYRVNYAKEAVRNANAQLYLLLIYFEFVPWDFFNSHNSLYFSMLLTNGIG